VEAAVEIGCAGGRASRSHGPATVRRRTSRGASRNWLTGAPSGRRNLSALSPLIVNRPAVRGFGHRRPVDRRHRSAGGWLRPRNRGERRALFPGDRLLEQFGAHKVHTPQGAAL